VIYSNFIQYSSTIQEQHRRRIASLAMLEEVVRVLSSTSVLQELQDSKRSYGNRPKPAGRSVEQGLLCQSFNLLNLVRSSETIEEVDERNASFQ
jgi:hypothetical protein